MIKPQRKGNLQSINYLIRSSFYYFFPTVFLLILHFKRFSHFHSNSFPQPKLIIFFLLFFFLFYRWHFWTNLVKGQVLPEASTLPWPRLCWPTPGCPTSTWPRPWPRGPRPAWRLRPPNPCNSASFKGCEELVTPAGWAVAHPQLPVPVQNLRPPGRLEKSQDCHLTPDPLLWMVIYTFFAINSLDCLFFLLFFKWFFMHGLLADELII